LDCHLVIGRIDSGGEIGVPWATPTSGASGMSVGKSQGNISLAACMCLMYPSSTWSTLFNLGKDLAISMILQLIQAGTNHLLSMSSTDFSLTVGKNCLKSNS
jgi:hypothetical protein